MSGTVQDELTAIVSTGTGTTQKVIDLTSATPIVGTFVPVSPAGTIGDSPLVLYNWNPATQLTNFINTVTTGGNASIAAIGNSTVRGDGSAITGNSQLSYLAELSQALTQSGVPAQYDNFVGEGDQLDNRFSLIGGAKLSGLIGAGGAPVQTKVAGAGFSFTLSTPANYDTVTISYIDRGNGSVSISSNGGPVLATLQFGNTGETLTQTVKVPAADYSNLTVVANDANPTYIQAASFSSSTHPAIQVFNAGIDGYASAALDTSIYQGATLTGSASGYGPTAGVVALNPTLTLVDVGICDIIGAQTGGVPVPTATTVANIAQIVATLRAGGSDVILFLPAPFSNPNYATMLPALRTGLEALALTDNLPIIDLSATYGDNYAALQAAGLMTDALHPDATLYADIGSKLAALLTNAITGAPCYAAGTRIATANGYVAVEDLKICDAVLTLHAGFRRIKWIGTRSYAAPFANHAKVLPIRIKAGALETGVPVRDLYVSPGHAICIDGVLVHAQRLVNGVSIIQVPYVETITYFHIELESHEIIFAENCPAETFMGEVFRAQFHNAAEYARLYPDSRAPAQMCLPRLDSGFQLLAIQRRIAARAGIATPAMEPALPRPAPYAPAA